MPHRLLPFLVVVSLLAGGCSHMPVTSMVRLARVDFAKTDPAQLRAAVKLPRAVQPRPHGVALRIGVKLANGQEETADFRLRDASDPADLAALQSETEPGTQVFAYRLDDAEVARIVAFRTALTQKQEASGGRGGGLTIAVRPDACRTGDLGTRPVYLTTYLRTGETGDYVPLARNVDLRTLAPGRDIAAEIPRCS